MVQAFETEEQRVVGFMAGITDPVQSAFIPLLEVLHQGQGIGTEVMRRMVR